MFWPGECHGLCSPWGRRESDTTERFHSLHLIMYKDERVTHAQEPGICLSLAVLGLRCCMQPFSSCGTRASRCDGLSRRRAWAPARAQWLQLPGFSAQALQVCAGLVAPQHPGSSQIRARTHVPCIARWILYHGTIREVLLPALK